MQEKLPLKTSILQNCPEFMTFWPELIEFSRIYSYITLIIASGIKGLIFRAKFLSAVIKGNLLMNAALK